ncbi:uncharacterized protein LOC133911079 [Phragmites australis]|uniref:uncharacterized protein LOC133911079 n=1 Tax=Phragmites australis TaxID=29695 RepID=UPI002D79C7D8|nr:uncharacterized protein LOC133911079 [Phragmites australis]
MAEYMADNRGTATGASDDSAVAAHPVAVKRGVTISVTVVLLALLVASLAAFLMSSPHASDGGQRAEGASGGEREGKRAEPVEHAIGDVGIPGFNSRLDAFRTLARLTLMKLWRPRSDEPQYGSAGSVTDAAKKSFEMGKDTVDQAAAAAAKATGDAVEKVKGAASPARPATDDAEL